MMATQQLPTWQQIAGNAIEALNGANSKLSDARDELHSDWKPGSLRPSDHPGDRHEVYKLIGEAKAAIERGKRLLYSSDD